MESFLSNSERASLLSEHSIERERRYADRIKTLLLLDDGFSFEEVTKVLFLDETTIRRYYKLYKEEGLDRLLDDNWEGCQSRLSKTEEEELFLHLDSTLYVSTKAIALYVMKTFKVKYTTRGMHHLLVRLGFVYKKTRAVPGKANAEAQEKFVSMYEYLLENKVEEDPIYFIDGVHAQHNSHPSKGWILRGKEHHVATNTGRQRVNINGALNAETLEVVIREDPSINAQSTTALFAGLEQNHQDAQNIYVVLDNAGYYRNNLVTHYVNNSKICLLFLPPYSPNLNLIERLWKFFKKKVASNRYYESFVDFKKAAMMFFKKIQDYEKELDSLLVDRFEIIDPDFSNSIAY
jgi:Transposase and inactivated derivatives